LIERRRVSIWAAVIAVDCITETAIHSRSDGVELYSVAPPCGCYIISSITYIVVRQGHDVAVRDLQFSSSEPDVAFNSMGGPRAPYICPFVAAAVSVRRRLFGCVLRARLMANRMMMMTTSPVACDKMTVTNAAAVENTAKFPSPIDNDASVDWMEATVCPDSCWHLMGVSEWCYVSDSLKLRD